MVNNSNNKGKAVAVGKDSYGKRKRKATAAGDGNNSAQRKRKNRDVLQFFEDSADIDDYDDSDDDDVDSDDFGFDDDDFIEEQIETQPKVNNEVGATYNLPFIPKEEGIDEEEFDKMMEERYKEGSTFIRYADDDYEAKKLVERDYRMPYNKDPTIWKVKCMAGRERQSAFCLMQKFVDLQSLGTKLQIISAFAVDHIKSFIYIEADKQCDVIEACKGLSGIYYSRLSPVPKNEVLHLLSAQIKRNEVSEGMWAYVKNGKYKGDLAQVVAVNSARKRATVKLIPRIDLQALAAKFGGGVNLKKTAIPAPAPKLISQSELEEFRPLIQYRRDRDTGKVFQNLDGMMLKDGYLFKKVSFDSLSFGGVEPSEEELLKFQHTESNESADLEWLSQLYGEQRKKRIITVEKGCDKGEGSSGSSLENSFELYELVCFGRKDFGLIVGMEKDDHCKILKEGPEGPAVVTVERRTLKNGPFDMKFTALDQHKKVISINDTVRVAEGPSKDRQGIIRKIYRGIIFLYDENEAENGGYFCSKSQLCEKIKTDACDGKGGGSVASGFEEFTSSPKSPLSPKRSWQAREHNNDFKRGDKDGIFTVGQTLRIRVGPLKGYLCRVLGIRYSDVTVKLDSQQKILTVKSEHLAEVRGKSFATSTSEDPGSGSFKPFDLLGTEGGSGGWMSGAGTSAEGDRWNAGGMSAERSSWPSFPATGTSLHAESNPANPFGSSDNDPNKDEEDSAWGRKVTANQSSSWGSAAADGKNEDCWNKSAVKNVGSHSGASGGWGKTVVPNEISVDSLPDSQDNWGKAKVLADSPNVASASWGKNKDACDDQGTWKKSDPWDKEDTIGNSTRSWGAVTAEKNKTDSWGKGKNTAEAGSTLSWEKNTNSSMGEDCLNNEGAGWNQPKSWGKKEAPAAENPTCRNSAGDWTQQKGENTDETSGWKKDSSGNQDPKDGWNKPKQAEGSSWGKQADQQHTKQDGGSSWGKQTSQQHSKQDTVSSWGKQDGGSSWSKQADQQETKQGGGSSWGKQDDQKHNKQDGGSPWGKQDGESSWSKQTSQHTKQDGGSSWNNQADQQDKKQDGGSSWSNQADQQHTKQGGGSSWGKQDGGSSWSKQADQQHSKQDGGSSWGKKDGGSSWDNKGGWNSVSDDVNQHSNCGRKSSWNSGSSNADQESSWGKKGAWNSGSGDANQESSWVKKSDWNSGNEEQPEPFNKRTSGGGFRGRGGSDRGYRGRGDFGGRWGSDRGGFGGRGRSDRGGFGGRGRSDRGSYGGRGRSDRGGFGGRGGSDGGGFGGRGSSDRGGFGGRGRGRRDQGGGWNNNNSGEYKSFDSDQMVKNTSNNDGGSWNHGGSWSSQFGSANNEAGGSQRNNWKSSDSSGGSKWSGWNNSNTTKEVKGPNDQGGDGWNKGSGESSLAGGWGNQGSGWNSSTGSGNRGSNDSNTTKEVKDPHDQGGGWNKGSGESSQVGDWNKGSAESSQASGWGNQGGGWNGGTGSGNKGSGGNQPKSWNQSNAADGCPSKDAGEGSSGGGGWGASNSWGKTAGSSGGKGSDGSSKGGW